MSMIDDWDMDELYEQELVDLQGEFQHETDKAILILISDNKIWFPKSQMTYDDKQYDKGDLIKFSIPEWLANEKEVI